MPALAPPPLSAKTVAAKLNAKFAASGGGADGEPGVLIHAFDRFGEEGPTPWKVVAPHAELSDRLSSSLINVQLQRIFDGGSSGGFVLAPQHNTILCSWSVDAGTMSRTCDPPGPSDDCVPGCSNPWGPSTW
eukprot:6201924-Prymnesium_polylepis.2